MKTKKFGVLFIVARFHMKMNQSQLAHALGISQSKISKVEAGKLEPSASEFIWLANRLLNVDLLQSLEAFLTPARMEIEAKALKKAAKQAKKNNR